MHPERMGLDEFEEFGTALDPSFIREHNREMARPREELGERGKRARVQLIDRLAPRRCRAAVRRIRRDSMHGPGPQRKAPGIRDGQIGSTFPGVQRGPSPHDHLPLAIQANPAESHLRRLEQDPASTAERVEDGAGHRHASQVHERPSELRMQGDRQGERSVRDFRRFESGAIHPMQDPTEDEFLVEQNPIVDLRRVEIHAARLAEIGAQRSFDSAGVEVHAKSVGANPECTPAELLSGREGTNRLEISGSEFLADNVREAKPVCGTLDRPRDLEAEEIRTERRATNLDALRCHRGERLRAGEGRMFPGQLDEDAHGRRTSPSNMSLPPTVIFKWPGPFAPLGVLVRPFVPNDIPAVASIVREALRENYPTSLYLDIHRWWRDGFLVADLDGHPVGFLAAVISADGQARILMFAVTSGFRKRGFGSQLMNAFVQVCAMRGIRMIELEVRISNDEAIRFYKRYGFEIGGVLEKFYTDGEDGYKMIRRL